MAENLAHYPVIEIEISKVDTCSEVGMRNFFLSPQSQLRNFKEAHPQSQFRNFLKIVAPQSQLRNSAIAIFSEVRNLRALLPQFSANFWHGAARNYIFFSVRCVLLLRGF
jgi:hypothetical protein